MPVKEMNMQEAKAQLKSVRSQIKAEHVQQGIAEKRPVFLIDKFKFLKNCIAKLYL